MLRESWVKFHSPQNISGASHSVATISQTTEVDAYVFWNKKKLKTKNINGFILV